MYLNFFPPGAPCLSFDIIKDNFGDRREAFPMTAYLVAGTQSDRPNNNSVIVVKVTQLLYLNFSYFKFIEISV